MFILIIVESSKKLKSRYIDSTGWNDGQFQCESYRPIDKSNEVLKVEKREKRECKICGNQSKIFSVHFFRDFNFFLDSWNFNVRFYIWLHFGSDLTLYVSFDSSWINTIASS